MQLTQTAEFFTADGGSAIVFYRKDIGGGKTEQDITISPDGTYFYELKGGHGLYSPSHGRMKVYYTDEPNGADYEIIRDGDAVTVNGTPYTRAAAPAEIDFIPLPVFRMPEYLFMMRPSGHIIYISVSVLHCSLESYRFYIGPFHDLRQVQLTGVEPLRGECIDFKTVDGVLSANLFGGDARWTPIVGASIALRTLDETMVRATETDDGITMEYPLGIPQLV